MYVIFLYLFILQTHSKNYLRQPKIIKLNAYNYAYILKHRTVFRKIVLKSISFTYTLSLCPLFFQKCFLYFIGFFLVIRDRVMSLVRFSVIQNLHRKSNPLASTRPISIGSCLLLCNFFKITFNKKLRIQKLLKYQSRELNLLSTDFCFQLLHILAGRSSFHTLILPVMCQQKQMLEKVLRILVWTGLLWCPSCIWCFYGASQNHPV